jgi:hypothetical protein
MVEGFHVEVRGKPGVEDREDVPVEGGGHPGAAVISASR